MKLDPYLQIDAWTMSPYEHGETFVTKDWFETDLDLWHYERFIDKDLDRQSSVTTWQIYQSVITKERAWDYLWQTVQVIPHVTDEIKDRIKKISDWHDLTIVEIGWTVWDIEWPHFLETMRQLRWDIGKQNICFVHVVPILQVTTSWEMKTKAIQHSVVKLREVWVHADILVCRTPQKAEDSVLQKIANFCDLPQDHIIQACDEKSIYSVPEAFHKQWMMQLIEDQLFGWTNKVVDLDNRNKRVQSLLHPAKTTTIAIAWKYTSLDDSYISVVEALRHAGSYCDSKTNIVWMDTASFEWEDQENDIKEFLQKNNIDGIIVPWWFWTRWVEWKINIARYARVHKIPYLGICLWLQIAVIWHARFECWLADAHSTECTTKTTHPVITIMQDQQDLQKLWWTMRLWHYPAHILTWTKVHILYNAPYFVHSSYKTQDDDTMIINERHRHRYEVNPFYHQTLQKNWLTLSWMSPDGKLVEYIEYSDHPFFVATQAHPELQSRLSTPHPLFVGLVQASLEK